jgi:hypothetical protein
MSLQIISIIVSISALALALFTYFKHDSKLKKQSALINKFQLDKFNKEKEDEKKAKVEVNIINKNRGGGKTIKVFNKGKATAKNVNVLVPNIEGIQFIQNPFPVDIKPQASFEIILFLSIEAPDTFRLEYKWQDEFSDTNTDYQILQL